jgi:hypothetical protein
MAGAERVDVNSEAAEENRRRAAAEISTIFELNGDRNFQWFVREFIDGPYTKAFDALRNQTMRMEGELIDPRDEEIPRLRERLSRL